MTCRAAPLLVLPLVFTLSACFEPVALGVSDESDAGTAPKSDGGGASADAAGAVDAGLDPEVDAGRDPISDAGQVPDGDAGVDPQPDAGTNPGVDAGPSCVDRDGDGYGSGTGCKGPDCNDDDATVSPAAPEVCDGRDNNCNQVADEGVPTRSCRTACGAGTERCSNGTWVCSAPQPRPETCDGTDEDCNGAIDDGVIRACATACGAGVEVCARGLFAGCTAPRPTPELCGDAQDNDCNGQQDENCGTLTGIFVSDSNGSDLNSGGRNSPVKTIGRGLQLAAAGSHSRVYVAAGTYRESLTLVDRISLLGGYDPGFSARNPAANATVLESTALNAIGDAPGLLVPGGVSNQTVVDGFSILGRSVSVGTSAAITINGSPVISNCSVRAGSGGRSYGIQVATPPGTTALAEPLLRNVQIAAAEALGTGGFSVALNCTGSAVQLQASTLTGGRARSSTLLAPSVSIAAALANCRLTSTSSKFYGGQDADFSGGIVGQSAVAYVEGGEVDARNDGRRASNGAAFRVNSTAHFVDVKVNAGQGCSRAGPQADSLPGGYGILAIDSAVTLEGSTVTGAANPTNLNCGTAGLQLDNSAGRVLRSRIQAGAGVELAAGIHVRRRGQGSAYLELDASVVDGAGGGSGSSSSAVRLEGAGARITNSVILGGSGRDASGVSVRVAANLTAELDLNGNYVSGGGVADTVVSRAITYDGSDASAPRGVIRNNIIVGGRGGEASGLVEDASASFNPVCRGVARVVENNDFFGWNGAGGLYVRCEGGELDALTEVAALNALPQARDNISADPKLTGTTLDAPDAFHLLDATSPCYNAGTRAGAPAKDLDGQDRPRAGAVDIGPDEL